MSFRTLCVFCGSRPGRKPEFRASATALGTILAHRNIAVVYGGGSMGLMGTVANAALAAQGRVVGVIPEALVAKELAHARLSELHVVPSMHARKAMMAELSDGFVALPGGFGTFEELFEIVTWAQLGMHTKPMGLLNVAGFFDPLLELVDRVVDAAFILPEHRDLLLEARTPEALLDKMAAYVPPPAARWVTPEET